MAIYSTFFLAEPSQLPIAFPDWKAPLPEPVTRTTVNPFTREEMTTTTREPEWDDLDPDSMEFPEPQVVAVQGDYRTYLEQRIPPFVRSQPHCCAKNLTLVELEPLIAAATGAADLRLESPLYAHPALSCGLEEFPDDFLIRLKSAKDADLVTIAQQWATTMSTPAYTHSVSGDRLSDGWSCDDALILLKPIADLVKQHAVGQVLYLLTEF